MPVKIANGAFATLAGNISAAQTLISLTAGQGARFPVLSPGDWFWGTLVNAANVKEIVKVTAANVDTFTVQRGQDGTPAAAFVAGDRFELRTPAALWNDFLDKATFNTTMTALFHGVITMWSGALNAIPAGWHLCDGTNGTPNLKDRFVVGAGGAYAVGDTGGNASYTLTVNQLPSHGHGVTDPTHAHGVHDNGHIHGVNDPGHNHPQSPHGHGAHDGGHAHPMPDGGVGQAGADNGGITAASPPNGFGGRGAQGTGTGFANIGIDPQVANIFGAATGISLGLNNQLPVSIFGGSTGISIQNTGQGDVIENRPPFYALAYIMYTG